MTTSTQTITEFLLDRIAEDEAHGGVNERMTVDFKDVTANGGSIWRSDYPFRLAAECEAKRRIVELHALGEPVAYDAPPGWRADELPRCAEEYSPYPCTTLRILASVYADHPDYRQEWRA